MYHDSASSGYDDHHNVLADSPGMWWLLINGQGSNATGGNVPGGCNFSAPSCRGNNSVHHNFADATCNMTHAECMGKSALNAHGKADVPAGSGNGTCSVFGNSFVPTSADFPPEARAIMRAAGPSGTLGPHGASPGDALHGRRNDPKPGAIPPVVVGANASAPEQAAAERLRHYLQLICGEHVELLASPVAGQQLAVGFDASVAAGLPASALEGLGDDGHIISSNRSAKLRSTASVAMAGADGAPRGTLYAVFGFLRTLGVEWYAVDEIPIPRALPTPFPPAVDRTVRPTMLMRDTDQWPVPQDLSQPPSVGVGEWSTALGFNGEHACSPNASKGGCITYAAPPTEVHTSYRFFDPDWTSTAGPPPQLWRDHPEWAWPRDNGTSYGQLCWSNASLVDFLIEKVKHFAAEDPTARVISISQVSYYHTASRLWTLAHSLTRLDAPSE